MKIATMTCAALLCFCPAAAQKEFRAVKSYLKAKNGTEALKAVRQLELDSQLRAEPRLYQMGMQACELLNDVENEKVYLKQDFDTLSLFRTTYDIFRYALRCDSAETAWVARERRKYKYRSENAERLRRYSSNLKVAANYFYMKKDYREAVRFYAMIVEASGAPLWEGRSSGIEEEELHVAASRHLHGSYMLREYGEVPRYEDLALRDTAHLAMTLELLAQTAAERQDTVLSLRYLREGLAAYPRQPFFFTNLADYYGRHGEYGKVLVMADTLLAADSASLMLLEAKSLALLNLRRYAESIEVSRKCLALDSTLTEAYYYIGASYCNLAAEVELPANINSRAYREAYDERKAFYGKARPYVERYRELAPGREAQWAPLLYNIYLNLNRGRQFEEIERILDRRKE